MVRIQNDNITFRVTTDLKCRLTEFCLEVAINIAENIAI